MPTIEESNKPCPFWNFCHTPWISVRIEWILRSRREKWIQWANKPKAPMREKSNQSFTSVKNWDTNTNDACFNERNKELKATRITLKAEKPHLTNNKKNRKDRIPESTFSPRKKCGRTKHTTDKCYVGDNAEIRENTLPTGNRKTAGKKSSLTKVDTQ